MPSHVFSKTSCADGELPPFSLLGTAKSDVLREIEAQYGFRSELIEDVYPCTPIQQGLLSLTTKQAGDYVMQATLELASGVSLDAFCAAWEEIVSAMPILRTRIVHHSTLGLLQVVMKERIRWVRIRQLERTAPEDETIGQVFGQDLSRYTIVELEDEKRLFDWRIHHALYDGWSLAQITSMVNLACRGGQLQAPQGFNSFVKYALAQNGAESQQYWQSIFDGNDFVQFPTAPSATSESTRASKTEHRVRKPPTRPLGITNSTLISAAWALVAADHTGSNDVVFGTTVSGRDAQLHRIKDVAGPTIATVPVRVRCGKAQSVFAFLEEIQREAVERKPYEQMGMQAIAAINEDTGRACTFQTAIVVQPVENDLCTDPLVGHWQTSSKEQVVGTYALMLQCYLLEEEIRLEAIFNPQTIDTSLVHRLLERMGLVIGQLAESTAVSNKTVAEIKTMTAAEEQQIFSWNSKVPEAEERCIHELVQHQTIKRPDTPAVRAWDGELTYRQLDELSTSLAHQLAVKFKVQPGVLVPMCFQKSMWAVVAMLGILKAGGAFVPLDPAQAARRRDGLLNQLDAGVVLASENYAEMAFGQGRTVVAVGEHNASTWGDATTTSTHVPPNPTSAAYLIFTSGSTGEPKGVVIEHRSVSTSCRYNGAAMGITDTTRVYQFAAYTFDVSIQEIFTTLIYGGCVCVPSDEDRLRDIGQSMNSMSVNLTLLTPSTARLIQPSTVPTLRTIVLGGEKMTDADIRQWTPEKQVFVTYGPSECAISCTTGQLDHVNIEERRGYIGAPLGCVTWIVDSEDHNRLAPMGAVGELLIEGPIVGRGYLNDDRKTAAVFLNHTHWLEKTGRRGRLYKTGDLVRYGEDGSLIFVGRKDTQVKIRGQRVELGEVEHHLRECIQNAREVIVEVIKPAGKDSKPMLAAFLGLDIDQLQDSGGIRVVEMEHQLADRLPAYMIPSVCFALAEMPKTTSNKTDRKQLIKMGQSFSAQQLADMNSDNSTNKRQPTTELEFKLQELWARVLNISPATVGLDDSFFRLGGDSITAMQVSSVARSLQLNISTSDVLQKKTISRLLSDKSRLTMTHSLSITADEQSDHPFILSPIQELYLHLQSDPAVCFDQCFLLRLNWRITSAAIEEACNAVTHHHPMLRARFRPGHRGRLEQSIGTENAAPYEFSHYTNLSLGDMARAVAYEREKLDIERGPLFVAALFDDTDGQSLFLSIHHLVVDLMSWRIILQDLEELLTVGSIAAPPTTTFQTWCTLQTGFAAQQPTSDYALPFELRPPMLDYWGVEVTRNLWGSTTSQGFRLDRDVTTKLMGSCNDVFQTRPVELFLSAMIRSFGLAFTDRSLPPVFCEGHGRESWDSSIDLSRTVGWFTTVFPVQLDSGAEHDLRETIRQTKDCIRSFSSNGWLYFASRFIEEQSAEEFISLFPAEIAFNYVGAYQQLERDDALFEILSLPDGASPESASLTRRISLFEISVTVDKGCLDITFTYPKDVQRQADVMNWLKQYEATLTQMADDLPGRAPEWTLADFPLAFKSYADLDAFRDDFLPRLESFQASDVEDVFPCSPMQEGMLISQAKNPENYRVALLLEVVPTSPEAKIDIFRLRNAWASVVQRHSLLRALIIDTLPGASHSTHIVLRDPEPGITCLPNSDAITSVEVFRERHGLNSYHQGDLQHHVTLCQGPNEASAYFHLEMNHAISDGYTQNILLADLQEAYSGNIDLAAPSYRDYISHLAKQEYGEARRYWSEYLTGVEPCYFPTLRDGSQREEVDHSVIRVRDLDVKKILAFCAEWEVTVATVVQAAWALILSRYSGSTTPCFGNLSSGRDLPIDGVDNIVGPLIGMLTCRLDLVSPRTLLELLREVQEDTWKSLQFQSFPLSAVHSELKLGAIALFNSGVSVQNHGGKDEAEAREIQFEYIDQFDPTEYDIHVNAAVSDTRLDITISYGHQIMTATQATRVAESLSVALSALTSQPHRRVQEVDIMGPSDIERLWEWNCDVPVGIERCVYELVDDQTAQRPDAPAICAWDGNATYAELDELSTNLAGHLQSKGIGKEMFVPMCFEKSMWAVVAILGVLKSGGAFVPLDPSQAPRRREGLLAQTNASIILTSPKYADLAFGTSREVIPVGPESASTWTKTCSTSLIPPTPNTAAYMIFTSGSTGEPKGVLIEHRSVGTSCWHHGGRVGFHASSRVLQFAAYTFDASLMDVLTTLIYGGCICIPSEEDRLVNMAQCINSMEINLAFLTPSIARHIEPSSVPTLRTLILGGERVANSDYIMWSDEKRTLLNGYGPTECSIGCMVNTMDSNTVDQGCIGKAVGSVSWIVDAGDHNKLVPIGVVGELLIEGPIVGRGYHCRPEKTDEVFVRDPDWLTRGVPETPDHSATPGRHARLYKTGDLARYNEDGSVSFIGRKDNQVKIRGQRVELGEIEYQVQQCLGAYQIAVEVILPANDASSAILGAFVCIEDGKLEAADIAGGAWAQVDDSIGLWIITVPPEAEDQLARHLPSYMVPTVYFRLLVMPMTVSGKIDRVRLRQIGSSFSVQRLAELRSIALGTKRQPTTDIENQLQQLWSQVLHISPELIGLDDNFFLLGGQSIAAMKLVTAARSMGLQFSVADVFQHPKLHGLAKISQAARGNDTEEVPAFSLLGSSPDVPTWRADIAKSMNLEEAMIEDMYPCTALQEGLMALSIKKLGDYVLQNVLHLSDVNITQFKNAWEQTVRCNPILRTRIVQHSVSGLLQVAIKEPMLWIQASNLEKYLQEDRSLPMGLGQPLVRYAFISDNCSGPRQFVFTIHHALYDGWSLPRVMASVSQIYNGKNVPQNSGFNIFVKYLMEHNEADIESYWQSIFAACEPQAFPTLPTSVHEPKANSIAEHRCSQLLTTHSQITLSSLVRAAWAIVHQQHTGSTDVVFGAIVSGRDAPVVGIENIIGPTIATIPVVVHVRPSQSVSAFLREVQDASIEMIPYQHIGLQRIAKINASTQRGCNFQTLLVVQPPDDGPADTDALGEWRLASGADSFSSYALTLTCSSDSNGVILSANFDSRVIEPWLMEKMLEELDFVMQQLVQDAAPNRTLGDIDTLTPSGREEIWLRNSSVPSVERCIHDLIDEQVTKHPQAPAITAWDGQLSYEELQELSTRLAHHLIELGVTHESFVPLYFEKSMWTIVAMLGVFKAGGAFVPFDPAQSSRRRQTMLLDQTDATIVLMSAKYAGSIPVGAGRKVVTVSRGDAAAWEPVSQAVPTIMPTPSSAAYMLFTSGSTGEPKGVVIEHHSLSSSCWYHGARVGFNTSSRVLQFAAYTFDACIMEIITTLIYGGCICVPSDKDRLENLPESMSVMDVNMTFLTPSVARLIKPASVPTLQTLILGGERVTEEDVKRWEHRQPPVQLYNGYGPTECTVFAVMDELSTERPVVIGKSVGSVGWIVDANDHNKLVPLGAVGELVVEGPIVGREYLHDAVKTAAAYIRDPVWLLRGAITGGIPGRHGRVYKTGDLVRYTEHGRLSYMGRKDNQAKIRGQRIELGEVEHSLAECIPDSSHIVAEIIVPERDGSSPMLVGFICIEKTTQTPTGSGIEAITLSADAEGQLRDRLPGYMMPSAYFSLTSMPTTTSGKIDRKRLREIGASFSAQQLLETSNRGEKCEPTTEVELQLQRLWSRVLNLTETIGLDDSFFLLGGDSIGAMKLVAEANEDHLSLSVADIFRCPTLAQMAQVAIPQDTNGHALDYAPKFSLIEDVVNVSACCDDIADTLKIDVSEIEDIYPCTALQEGLVALTTKQPGAYVWQKVLKMSPDTDLNTFCEAWERTVQAIPVLRTRIVQHKQIGLLQVVLKDGIQWAQADNLDKYLEQDQSQLMGLDRPLARYALIFDASTKQRWFVWTIHHALYDGWSLPQILKMAQDAYKGIQLIQRPGFSLFVKNVVEMNRNDGARKYWESLFSGCNPETFPPLPLHASTRLEPRADSAVDLTCPVPSTPGNITLSTLIRAAWALVLHHHTSSADVVYGVTLTGRNAPVAGIENIVGPTIATVPIIIRTHLKQSVAAYLDQVQDVAVDMIPYEQTGLQQIAKFNAETSQCCKFQNLLVIQPVDDSLSERESVFGEWGGSAAAAESFSSYGLVLEVELGVNKINAAATFDSRMIEPWLVRKLLERLASLMHQLTEARPEQTLAELNMITSQDLQQMWDWNKTVPEPVNRCVHDMVDESIKDQPTATAVSSWDGDLTYAELGKLSSRLAQRLISLGVGVDANAIVPLCFEKSRWAVVAMLAVLKTGAAFVLLDPSLPESRLRSIIEQTKSTLVVLSIEQASTYPDLAKTTVRVGSNYIQSLSEASDLPIRQQSPSSTMYVIFTSGSTGKAKGVLISHRAFCSATVYQAGRIGFVKSMRSYDFASYAFDASIEVIFFSLATGGCLIVPSDWDRKNNLTGSLVASKAELVDITPSVVRTLDRDLLVDLKVVIMGGEPAKKEDVTGWHAGMYAVVTYGPSECTPQSMVKRGFGMNDEATNIGYAAGSVTWVVDAADSNRLAPVGAVGELLLEGPVVGQGYLYDPEKTAAVFIQDPTWLLNGAPGHLGRHARMYKTGDLVRYNGDGSLNYIGRKDNQVKIRGQRVELGEVENHILACVTGIREVAAEVILPVGNGASPTLAAFLLMQDDYSLDGTINGTVYEDGDLRALVLKISATADGYLTERLPKYMDPAVYFTIKQLPMNSSGKTDRRKIRAIGASFSTKELAEMLSGSHRDKPKPSTAGELVLQEIWSRILDIDASAIGADDSFFHLGGDSIAAMKLVAEARRAGITLSVADVFHNSQLSALARLSSGVASGVPEKLEPFALLGEDTKTIEHRNRIAAACDVDPELIEDAYPCTPLQEGLLSLTAKSIGAYTTRSVLALSENIDIDLFRHAWEQVAQKLPILRTRIIQDADLGLIQVVINESIQWQSGHNLKEFIQKDFVEPMSLGQSLSRYAIIIEEKEKSSHQRCCSFVWTVHHVLYDGQFFGQIPQLAYQIYKGLPQPMFKEFKYFAQYIKNMNIEAAETYWKSQFHGYEFTPFPAPLLPSEPVRASCFVQRKLELPPRVESNITAASLIRAAWALTMGVCSNSADVVFGVTVTGRQSDLANVEDIAGPTFATVPVRVQLSKTQAVTAYLHQVQDQSIKMIPYEQAGLQRIKNVSEEAQLACQFQTILIIQPAEKEEDDFDDKELGTWSGDENIQNFASYALNLICTMSADGVVVDAIFDPAAISEWVVQAMMERLDCAIQQLASAAVDCTLDDIDVLSVADYEQIWSRNAEVPTAVDRCIHTLVGEQATIRPGDMAVCAWDGKLTYAELYEKSTRLAHVLTHLGVGEQQSLVPMLFEKSRWIIVAMLAVMMAGGAIIPIDPSQPADRRERLVAQTGAKLIITSAQYEKMMTRPSRVIVAVSEKSIESLPKPSRSAALVPVEAQKTVYIMFTSGDDGQPKGVVIDHQAHTTSCLSNAQSMKIGTHTRMLQHSPYSVDTSMLEIFATLAHGGCVCVPSESQRLNELEKFINENNVNFCIITPTVSQLLEPSRVPSLSTIILTGETCEDQVFGRWTHQASAYNAYRQTECTTCSLYEFNTAMPYGFSLGTAVGAVFWVTVTGDVNRLAPPGAVGELLIEGPVLAQGYLNNLDKTEASFIRDPPWLLRGASGYKGRHGRLYKTGDLVRYREDGSLVYVGRHDTRVIIRGQRVDLAEIEYQVKASIPGVKRVIAKGMTPSGDEASSMLAAFLVMEQSLDSNKTVQVMTVSAAIDDELAERLPAHMIPAIYFTMNELPLNSSGKIDVRSTVDSLSAQQVAEILHSSRSSKRIPSTVAELALQQIWARILNVNIESISADDSFFRLGGDSIAAMKLVSEARRIGIAISVTDIFRNPRLSALANISRTENELSDDIEEFTLLGEDVALSRSIIAAACHLEPSLVQDAYPCTSLQEGLLSLTTQSSGAYVERIVVALPENVNLDMFRYAWEQAVRSLSILRTRIIHDERLGLVQVVVKEDIQWASGDILSTFLQQDAVELMGLGCPLSRYAIVQDKVQKSQRAWFVWTIHHALYDGQFLARIPRLINQLYKGLPPPAFKDFKYFAKYLENIDTDALNDYWRSEFKGYDSAPFPTSSGTMVAADSIAERQLELPPVADPTITLDNLIRAAWALVIAADSGLNDVVFGTTVSGRKADVAGIENLAGPTIATVPIRIQIIATQGVTAYLRQVQEQSIQMIPYEQAGLQRIREISEEARRACQFQSLLIIQPSQEGDITQLASGELGQWTSDSEATSFSTYALNVTCALNNDGAKLEAVFDSTAISKWNVEAILERLSHVIQQLASVVEGQPITVADIDLLSATDSEQLSLWNNTVPSAVEKCVHTLIEEQALAYPQTAAVCAWDGELTYSELESQANKLAHYLVGLGVGPDGMVAICFDKSKWAIVAMLAILKAGGAFVPLDASQALSRREAVLAQIGALVVLTSSTYATLLATHGRVFSVDEESIRNLPSTSGTEQRSKQQPSSAAYVFFTSGSTGQPKGVVVDHRAVSTSCVNHGREIAFNRQTRVLQFTSYTFDVSIMEILTTLIYGGCICVPSEAERFNDLEESIERMKANLASLTPSVARLLDPSRTPSLDTIVLAGENAGDQDFDRWSHLSRINAYGPTESTIFCSINKISPNSKGGGSCIGKAVASVSWVVLPSDTNRLAPIGAIGELLVEGPILARGYLNDPDKTEKAFIENPPWLLRSGRHGRLYKTGDLVRYNPNGSLTYMGRKDNQVKIRGQRVDLGEVEYHVQACIPGIRQVVAEVVVPGGDVATPILAAFVVLDKTSTSNVAQVINVTQEAEDKLSERLPVYMIPKVFFALSEISINASGKTDRNILRSIGAEFSAQRLAELQSVNLANKRAPSSEIERALQQIWARVLNIDSDTIGADESFFRLGGDSITAMQVSAAARSSQIDISTADVLRKKTISRIAASALLPKHSSGLDITYNHDNDGQPFQLGPIQQFHTQLEPNPTKCFDQNFLLGLRKSLPLDSVAEAIEIIVSRHPMLRARFSQTSEGTWQQRITDDVPGSFRIRKASNTIVSGPEEAQCIRNCRELLDIESGPLLAAVLYEDGAENQKLFITVHHLVIDLVSWRVLLMELEELFSVEKLDPLTTTEFRTWCNLQGQFATKYLESPQLEAIQAPPPLLSYWGIQSDENVIGSTVTKSFVLGGATSAAILGDCNNVFNTRPMELMAAALIHSFRDIFEGREAPAIFSEGHGRETWDDNINISRTIGWFTTIFPVHVPTAEDGSVVDAIRQTKDFVRNLSKNGWSYFTSRFADQKKAMANIAGFPVEILLNFAGSYQQLERGASLFEPLPLPEGCDPESFSGVRRYALFDVFAATDKGRLAVSVVYPRNARHQSKINMWIEQYQSLLQNMASQLLLQSRQWTLADFPMAFQSYDDLTEFQTRLLPQMGIDISDIEDIYPCTPVQERILAVQEKNPETYRVVLELEILATDSSNRIDLSRIKQTWHDIVQRHSVLRAHLVNDIPGRSGTMHVVLKDAVPVISYTPNLNGSGDNSSQNTSQVSVGYSKRGLQHHLSISQPDEARAHIRIEINHAIIDGHSVNVLIRDFSQAYHGNVSPPAPSHSEFMKHIHQQSGQADPEFWPTYLNGVSPCLIPTSNNNQRDNGTFSIDVTGIDSDKLHGFCAKWEVTMATIVQTAWALVLRRYTGSTVPCFGMLTSGRDVPVDEVNNMFGALISLIPCRIRLDRPRSVLAILKDVQEDYADCLPHQAYALAKFTKAVPRVVVAELFNTAISFQRAGDESASSEKVGAVIYRGGQDPVEHDVYIRVLDGHNKLRIVLEFWENRISKTQSNEMAAFLASALSTIISAPEQDILNVAL